MFFLKKNNSNVVVTYEITEQLYAIEGWYRPGREFWQVIFHA